MPSSISINTIWKRLHFDLFAMSLWNTNFRMMCFHGDIEGVRTALDNGADVNEATFNGGCTALMWALHRHHNDVVQVLLNHPEIDVNIVDSPGGRSALHWAVNVVNHEGLQVLLARPEIDVNKVDDLGRTPLHWAVNVANLEAVEALLARPELDVNRDDGLGKSALHWAVTVANHEAIEVLLAHPDIDVNKVDGRGKSALHWAVTVDNHIGLEALLAQQHLTAINQTNFGGRSQIMHAVCYNKVNCFNLLLANPRVDLETREDFTRGPQEVLR